MPPVSKPMKLESDDTALAQKVSKLEAASENLRKNYEDSLDDCEKAYKTIAMLERELHSIKSTNDKIKSECENQLIITEKVEMLQKTNDKLNVEKDNVIIEHEAETKKANLINNRLHQELYDLRAKHQKEKTEIIKNFKFEIKDWKKDLGVERKEKINLEKQLVSLKKEVKNKPETALQVCKTSTDFTSLGVQTDQHPEIPYSISDPLPPIFSVQLCHFSSRIGCLSNSLPNFNTICWVKSDNTFQDEAEEALNEHYDNQIKEFYISERERVKLMRVKSPKTIKPNSNLEHFEGHVILNITSSSRDSSIISSGDEDF